MRIADWRWLRIVWPFLATIVLLAAISAFSMDVLSSTRAFVAGESLWSKAHVEAVYHLKQYAATSDEAHFQQFQRAIAVPLGDREARLELEKAAPDLRTVRQQFERGGNHPDDIDGIVRLYRNFKNVEFMHKAILLWIEGDVIIEALVAEANWLQRLVRSATPDRGQIAASLDQIDRIALQLAPLERRFSASLGEASRRSRDVLWTANFIIAALILVLGSSLYHYMLRREARQQERLRSQSAEVAAEAERNKAAILLADQAALLDKARDAIIVTAMSSKIVFWSKGAERMYGWSTQEAIGQRLPDLLYEQRRTYEVARAALDAQGEWSGEVNKRCKDGTQVTVESRWSLVRANDGTRQSIMAIDTDISARKLAEAQMRHLAFHDPLTQLPNRMLLLDRLRQALSSSDRRHRNGALLFIDLDNFKTLNDTVGHDHGDLLLQEVAKRLVATVRESDTVARLGGDEFVIILAELDEDLNRAASQARVIGEKLLQVLAAPFLLLGRQCHSSASVGIALFNDANETVSDLLKQADLAMYQAKAAGRNAVRLFSPVMQASVTERAALESDLREALQEHQIRLHYQPQINAFGDLVGVEALARWHHPQRGFVSPADFIPMAEETGLIQLLGTSVLRDACAQLALWAHQTPMADLSIAVNVSVRQFHQPDFVDIVRAILSQSGANPQRLKLELTESLLADDVETTIEKMKILQQLGIRFSLDDFGTGYSSLSYLKRFPLDQLKIDKSFVRDVLNDPNDAAIARTIIALARTLDMEVIAEGVETNAQRTFLAEHHCHLYQGYLFSPPLPIDQLAAFIRSHRQQGGPLPVPGA